jgi:HK97 family phage prohead protease
MSKKDKQLEHHNKPPQPEGLERRVFSIAMRADDLSAGEGSEQERRTVSGYAALFNSPSEDMGFIEVIEPGAFREAIPTSDIRALFNHDPNLILARTASGTLRVMEDEKGLRYEFLIPETTFGNDFRIMLQRGDVSQSSFAFSVKEQAWETKKDEAGNIQYTRRIKKVERIWDVSPVTYPAYADTSVALRSMPPGADTEQEENKPTHRDRLLAVLEKI